MSSGGSRPGAGRRKGATTRLNDVARAKAAEGGITPLEYLLELLRDGATPREIRIDVAKAAAPYMHAKLQAVELTGKDGGSIKADVRMIELVAQPIPLGMLETAADGDEGDGGY